VPTGCISGETLTSIGLGIDVLPFTAQRRQGSTVGHVAVFIVDPHSIFRLGLATCLENLHFVGRVTGVDSVQGAWRHDDLATSDVVVVDASAPDALAFIRKTREAGNARLIASASSWPQTDILAAMEAGAVSVLRKDTLTPESLEANVRATLQGAGVLPSDLLSGLLVALHADDGHSSRLTNREEQVLRLIADGHATREVAEELCYSERTVKTVLHDVVTKLGARTRSHAVAHAVRAGLI
jgi:DNA-binding NarL/FixJ family response regulator